MIAGRYLAVNQSRHPSTSNCSDYHVHILMSYFSIHSKTIFLGEETDKKISKASPVI